MIVEPEPRVGAGDTRLLVLRDGRVQHSRVRALGELLERSDLLVVNRSGTAPASLRGRLSRTSTPVELRLASFLGPSERELVTWYGVLFGAGDWTARTEARGEPPRVRAGDRLELGEGLIARILDVDPGISRLVTVALIASNVTEALHRNGAPIQYSYLRRPISTAEQQTLFAGPAVSVEPPSAAFPLQWQQLLGLQRRGIELATVTHSAGISSTGDDALDRRLPLPEWFDVPPATADAIASARKAHRRIVALGTSVVRAVEASAGEARSGVTDLRIGPDRPPAVVGALLTGMHDAGTSHLELMRAFCGDSALARGYAEAEALAYRTHEYGDLTLVL